MYQKPDLGELSPNKFFDIKNSPFDIEKYQLFNVISGSRAYGTDNLNSDIDIRGVVAMPEKYIYGLSNFEQVDNQSKDVIFYSMKKFFELLIKNNVHALEMLFMSDRTINYIHPLFQEVIENKSLFISKRIGYTFAGYAFQQIKLMFTKKANNSGRQELIQKYSYDSKMAMHALRILRMGREALQTGIINVYRSDREELLEVRNGKYKLHELAVLGKNSEGKDSVVEGILAEEFRLFDKAFLNSSLPSEPNYAIIEDMLIRKQKQILLEFN